MSSFELGKSLDTIIPDVKIIEDIFKYLNQVGDTVQIEMDNEHVYIPKDIDIAIVNKMYIKECYDISFGTGYRVQAALGGVITQKHGILYAQYVFATLYYDAQGDVITIDFHKEMR